MATDAPHMRTGRRTVCMLLHRSLEHDSRVRREASALSAAGYSVTVLELAPTGPDVAGVQRRSVLSTRLVNRVPRRLLQALMMPAFLVWVVRMRPSVVHAHDVATLLPALVGARLTRARLVYDTHEFASGVYYRGGPLRRLVTAIERACIHHAALVITVSDAIAERLTDRHTLHQPPLVIRNFCALRRPDAADPPGGLRDLTGVDGEPMILHQGWAAPHRGCEALVRVLPRIPGAHLVFLGPVDPGFAERLADLASQEDVGGRVHFVGPVPVDSLLSFTREADVGASLFEPTCENYRLTLPNKVFEYVAAGVPVLVTDVPELQHVVREYGIGWTVDPYDLAGLRDGITTALAEAGRREMRDRLVAADSAFRWSAEASRLTDAYDAI